MTSTSSAAAPATVTPLSVAAIPKWERWVRWLILAVFVVAGVNHVHTNTFMGQDFAIHTWATDEIIKDHWRWFPQDITNRPMLYAVGALGNWLTHGKATYEMAGILCVLQAALALFFVHDSTRSFIRSPWLRLSAVAFVAFLPPTQVSIVVYAGDAVAPLPFAFTLWALVRCLGAGSLRTSAGYAALTALGLAVGNFARFPFLVLPAAGLLAIILTWRWGRISGGRALLVGTLALVASTAVGLWVHRRATNAFIGYPPHHEFVWKGTDEMSWRYLLFPKASDVRIFNAPGYWDPDPEHVTTPDKWGLPFSRNYTYPALFHLSLYTDVLNYADDGQNNNNDLRPEPQLTYSRWAVRLGLLTSLGMLVALALLVGRAAKAVFTRQNPPSTGTMAWGVMALNWYLPFVLVLPYVHNAYFCGYWLPRIVLPAIWGFGVVLFGTADEWLEGKPRWVPVAVGLGIFAQAAIHIRSVWF